MKFSFFLNFFNKKVRDLSVSVLSNELLVLEKERFSVFEKKAFSVFAQINFLLKKINSFSLYLNSLNVEKTGRVGKIVSSSKKDFINKLNLLTSKLIPPKKHSFNEIKFYSINSSELLERELSKVSKLIALTAFGLTREMKELGDYLKELNQAFNELQKNLIKSNLVELNELKLKILELNEVESKGISILSNCQLLSTFLIISSALINTFSK